MEKSKIKQKLEGNELGGGTKGLKRKTWKNKGLERGVTNETFGQR